ncbi:MAG: hypothetical protein OEV08_02325 [Nitrospira sp.]|nr:hypothetical protein [Nitrospira sp.]
MAYGIATVGLSSLHEQVVQESLEQLAGPSADRYRLTNPNEAEVLVIDGRSLEGASLLSAHFNDVRKQFIVVGPMRHPASPRIHHLEYPVGVREMAKLLRPQTHRMAAAGIPPSR